MPRTKLQPSQLNSEWWEELGRTTLGSSAASMTITSFTARKYLRLIVVAIPTGGTINMGVRFNNDTAAIYAYRFNTNGGADSTGNTQTAAFIDSGSIVAQTMFTISDIINVLAQEKVVITHAASTVAGAANSPIRAEWVNKWANTAAQITRVDIINPSGTGTFAAGSEVIVLGHD